MGDRGQVAPKMPLARIKDQVNWAHCILSHFTEEAQEPIDSRKPASGIEKSTQHGLMGGLLAVSMDLCAQPVRHL